MLSSRLLADEEASPEFSGCPTCTLSALLLCTDQMPSFIDESGSGCGPALRFQYNRGLPPPPASNVALERYVLPLAGSSMVPTLQTRSPSGLRSQRMVMPLIGLSVSSPSQAVQVGLGL